MGGHPETYTDLPHGRRPLRCPVRKNKDGDAEVATDLPQGRKSLRCPRKVNKNGAPQTFGDLPRGRQHLATESRERWPDFSGRGLPQQPSSRRNPGKCNEDRRENILAHATESEEAKEQRKERELEERNRRKNGHGGRYGHRSESNEAFRNPSSIECKPATARAADVPSPLRAVRRAAKTKDAAMNRKKHVKLEWREDDSKDGTGKRDITPRSSYMLAADGTNPIPCGPAGTSRRMPDAQSKFVKTTVGSLLSWE